MTTYRTAVEFGTNVGVLERDYARAATASRTFGSEAVASLKTATLAEDQLALASQRVAAADTRLVASRERLNAVMASGVATQREIAAAQTGFVASQEALLAAQAKQATLMREQHTAAVAAVPRGGLFGGGTVGLIAGLAATEGAIKIKDAIAEGARNASQLQSVDQQLASTLSSTHDVAGTTVAGIDDLSESISRQTGISEVATRSGALLELTFVGLRNEGTGTAAIFDRTQKAAANMAIGLHLAHGTAIDYQGSMQTLARALNDPVAGMTLLTRSGVSFTAQQKEQIKALAASGQGLKAQELILALVNQKYADAAKIFGATSQGAYDKTREALDQLEMKLASPLLREAPPVLGALRDTIGFFVDHPATLVFGEITTGVIGLAFAAATLERAMAFLKESQWATALLRMLVPLRSAARAEGALTVELDAQAAAAGRAAGNEAALATALSATSAAAIPAEVSGVGSLTQDAAAAGGLGGLLRGGGRLGALLRAGGFIAAGQGAGSLISHVGGRSGISGDLTRFGSGAAKGAGIGAGIGAFGLEVPVVGEITTGAGALIGGAIGGALGLFHHGGGGSSQPNADAMLKRLRLDPASLQEQAAKAAVAAVYGSFDVTAAPPSAAVHAAQQALAKANRELSIARGREAAARQSVVAAQPGGSADPNRLAAAQDRLAAASQRLNDVHSSGRATAGQLASAEGAVASARASLNALTNRGADATDRLSAAELRLKTAHNGVLAAQQQQQTAQKAADAATGLSVQQVLKRVTAQQHYQRSIAHDVTTLALGGVSSSAISALQAFEKNSPGTIHNFATHLTKRTADELNSQFGHLHADARRIADALKPGFTAGLISAAVAGSIAAQKELEKLAPSFLAAILGPAFSVVAPGQAGPFIANEGKLPSTTSGHAKSVPDPASGTVPNLNDIYGIHHPDAPGVAVPQVVVHVHTAAPSYTVKHEVRVGEVRAHDYHDFRRQLDDDARTRATMP